MPDECTVLKFLKGPNKFFFGVHDDGASPGDRLAQRHAGNQHKTGAFRTGEYVDLVAVAEKNGTACRLDGSIGFKGAASFQQIGERRMV